MAQAGPASVIQQDFSAGMFRSVQPELIPANGAYDITNGLLNDEFVIYRRGGSAWLGEVVSGSNPSLLWDGFLGAVGSETEHTVLGGPAGIWAAPTGAPLAKITSTSLGAQPRRGVAMGGLLFLSGGHTFDGTTFGAAAKAAPFYATSGNRLLAGEGRRVSFSKVNTPGTFEATDYHELPGGVAVVGMEGLREACLVFTTEGVWIINGLSKELTDEAGNVQQTLDRYSTDLHLWGDAGIAGWTGGLVVPARDGVWLLALGVASEAPQSYRLLSRPIADVYRSYVAAGCEPGGATVYHGHYILPIVKNGGVVDTLVCRLDGTDSRGNRTFPWTHLTGRGARATVLAETDQEARLFGATDDAGRLMALNYFEPSTANAADADGSAVAFEVTLRDITTGRLVPNIVLKARLFYSLSGALNVGLRAFFGSLNLGGSRWGEFGWGEGAWTSSTGPFAELEGDAPEQPAAAVPKDWRVGKKVRFARLKFVLEGSASTVTLRAVEIFIRSSGRS